MKYKIKVNYDSGDSFGREPDLEDFITPEWNDLDIAKENLKRLQAFVLWFEANRYSSRKKKQNQIEIITDKDWYCDHSSLYLYDDNDERIKQSAFWVGYFESLNYMEIVEDKSDMRFDA